MNHYGTICDEHPDALINHGYDLTQAVLNGLPSGEGWRSNHSYTCAECGKKLASLSEASAAADTARRVSEDFEKAAKNLANGWRP